jgi:hypothetical protein
MRKIVKGKIKEMLIEKKVHLFLMKKKEKKKIWSLKCMLLDT